MRKQTRRTSGSPSGPDRVKRARISEPRDQGPCDASVRAGNEDQGALVSAPAPHTDRVVGTKRKLECDARHEDMHSTHSELKSQFLGWTFLSSILMGLKATANASSLSHLPTEHKVDEDDTISDPQGLFAKLAKQINGDTGHASATAFGPVQRAHDGGADSQQHPRNSTKHPTTFLAPPHETMATGDVHVSTQPWLNVTAEETPCQASIHPVGLSKASGPSKAVHVVSRAELRRQLRMKHQRNRGTARATAKASATDLDSSSVGLPRKIQSRGSLLASMASKKKKGMCDAITDTHLAEQECEQNNVLVCDLKSTAHESEVLTRRAEAMQIKIAVAVGGVPLHQHEQADVTEARETQVIAVAHRDDDAGGVPLHQHEQADVTEARETQVVAVAHRDNDAAPSEPERQQTPPMVPFQPKEPNQDSANAAPVLQSETSQQHALPTAPVQRQSEERFTPLPSLIPRPPGHVDSATSSPINLATVIAEVIGEASATPHPPHSNAVPSLVGLRHPPGGARCSEDGWMATGRKVRFVGNEGLVRQKARVLKAFPQDQTAELSVGQPTQVLSAAGAPGSQTSQRLGERFQAPSTRARNTLTSRRKIRKAVSQSRFGFGSFVKGPAAGCSQRGASTATIAPDGSTVTVVSGWECFEDEATDNGELHDDVFGAPYITRRLQPTTRVVQSSKISPLLPGRLEGGSPGDKVPQMLREAYLNARLAECWRIGDIWARLDLSGVELRLEDDQHQTLRLVTRLLVRQRGEREVQTALQQLQGEWERLKALRQRYGGSSSMQGMHVNGNAAFVPKGILKLVSLTANSLSPVVLTPEEGASGEKDDVTPPHACLHGPRAASLLDNVSLATDKLSSPSFVMHAASNVIVPHVPTAEGPMHRHPLSSRADGGLTEVRSRGIRMLASLHQAAGTQLGGYLIGSKVAMPVLNDTAAVFARKTGKHHRGSEEGQGHLEKKRKSSGSRGARLLEALKTNNSSNANGVNGCINPDPTAAAAARLCVDGLASPPNGDADVPGSSQDDAGGDGKACRASPLPAIGAWIS